MHGGPLERLAIPVGGVERHKERPCEFRDRRRCRTTFLLSTVHRTCLLDIVLFVCFMVVLFNFILVCLGSFFFTHEGCVLLSFFNMSVIFVMLYYLFFMIQFPILHFFPYKCCCCLYIFVLCLFLDADSNLRDIQGEVQGGLFVVSGEAGDFIGGLRQFGLYLCQNVVVFSFIIRLIYVCD